ncbi:unnamed protein product [Merluccius merluccius]
MCLMDSQYGCKKRAHRMRRWLAFCKDERNVRGLWSDCIIWTAHPILSRPLRTVGHALPKSERHRTSRSCLTHHLQ